MKSVSLVLGRARVVTQISRPPLTMRACPVACSKFDAMCYVRDQANVKRADKKLDKAAAHIHQAVQCAQPPSPNLAIIQPMLSVQSFAFAFFTQARDHMHFILRGVGDARKAGMVNLIKAFLALTRGRRGLQFSGKIGLYIMSDPYTASKATWGYHARMARRA